MFEWNVLLRRPNMFWILVILIAASCGSSTSNSAIDSTNSGSPSMSVSPTAPATKNGKPTTRSEPRTLAVPRDFPTIQSAVNEARSGDLVLVDAGNYRESVTISTEDVTLRGVDRNTVVLDGGNELENGVLVEADGVSVENLTVQAFTFNGLLFTKAYNDTSGNTAAAYSQSAVQHVILQRYRARYVSTMNNGQYGIYAFFARGGEISNVYASGHPDSGIYVGQCKPCDVTISNALVENNAIGYEGTNASGNVSVINSVWRNNRIGVTPNSQNMEQLAPQGEILIAGNVVSTNNNSNAPATAQGGFGVGIAIGGGHRNMVFRNLVTGNVNAGILITDLNEFEPKGNTVSENRLEKNGSDLVVARSGGAPFPVDENCFENNEFASSIPKEIESLMPCVQRKKSELLTGQYAPSAAPPDIDFTKVPKPGPQPTMSDPNAPWTKLESSVAPVNRTDIEVPSS